PRSQVEGLSGTEIRARVAGVSVGGHVVRRDEHVDGGIHESRLVQKSGHPDSLGAPESGAMVSMVLYRERLWPAAWMLIATALVIPASLLVFLPISETAGIAVAVGLYGGCLILMFAAAP